MNPSVDDIKITLYYHLWELKLCLSFVGILFPFLRGRKYFYHRTFSLFLYPTFLLFYFIQEYIKAQGNQPTWNKLRRLLLIKLYYKNFFFKYIYASYHSSFSILSGCGIMFVQLSQKSDSKKLFGTLRTSEYSATSINCSSVT